MSLPEIWFILIAIFIAGYAILDGFDLGVGMLHPLARGDREKRLFINSIGPIWDGNEVWLVVLGGALFAAFPEAYATMFSGFYVPFMAVLFALIFRAVSIEFRSKMKHRGWRGVWDWAFFGSSLLASLLFGVAVGNMLHGLPLNERGVYIGGFFDLLQPYALLVGLLTVAMFAMHGAIYLYLKTEGAVQERLHNWVWHTWGVFLVLYILTTIYTLAEIPRAVANVERFPWGAVVVIVNVLAIANIPRAMFRRRWGQAFISSSISIAALVTLLGLALFPNLITASNDPANSLTIVNAASSQKTLWIMLIIAMIGMPFVFAYTAIVYWTFRGKVHVEGEHGY